MHKKTLGFLMYFLVSCAHADPAFDTITQTVNPPSSVPEGQTTQDASGPILFKLSEMQQQLSVIFGQLEILNNHYVQLQRQFTQLGAQASVEGASYREAVSKDAEEKNVCPDNVTTDVTTTVINGAPSTLQEGVTLSEMDHTSPEEAYQKARAFITQAKYEQAEYALRKFVESYSEHDLVSPALYWIGETYFVRKDFGAAAKVFAEGYQKYSNHSKAADHLLKLGMSLSHMDQTKKACATYRKLLLSFPKANATILALVQREIHKLQCQI